MTTLADRLATTAAAHGLTETDLAAALADHVDDLADRIVEGRLHAALIDRVRAATAARDHAAAEWRTAVLDAGAAGVQRRDLATAAGVTRQWVRTLIVENARRTEAVEQSLT